MANGQHVQAIEHYQEAIRLFPSYAYVYNDMGCAYLRLGHASLAIASYNQAIALAPNHVVAYSNRGNAFLDLFDYENALVSYEQALDRDPHYADAYNNRSCALSFLGDNDGAIASYEKAIALNPQHVNAHLNLAVCLLRAGDFERGLRLYEWRWELPERKPIRRQFTQPLWLGQFEVRHLTFFVHTEQGWGDILQFCRYVSWLADLGARVIFEVEVSLRPLLGSLRGVSQWITRGESLPSFDCHCSLASLPLAFKARSELMPFSQGYLCAPTSSLADWRARLGSVTKPRVGLVWRGNPRHENDRNRSMTLDQFLSICDWDSHVQYISLQKELRKDEKEQLACHPSIWELGSHIVNFADTAAICTDLDLLISVDTAVVHLAGALGKPVWVLLPFVADWRWQLKRSDSPWYDSARLYRQARPRDWSAVLEQIRSDCSTRFIPPI